jgi:hypothetical protein
VTCADRYLISASIDSVARSAKGSALHQSRNSERGRSSCVDEVAEKVVLKAVERIGCTLEVAVESRGDQQQRV